MNETTQSLSTIGVGRPLRVYVLDLLAVVPYYVGNLCAALGRQGGVAAVYGSTTYHRDPQFCEDHGVKVDSGVFDLSWKLGWAWPPVRRFARLAEYLLNLCILAARFSVRRPDILHVQFLPLISFRLPFEIWLLRYCRSLGIRLCCTVHNVLPHDSGASERVLWGRVYSMMDAFICHDRLSAKRLSSEFEVDPAVTTVIPHGPMFGADHSLTPVEAKRQMGYQSNCRMVLCQGIIRPYKGVPFLLDAWQSVARIAPHARLVVAGHCEKQLKSELEQAVSRLGIQASARLDLRFLPSRTVELYHQAADILAYPYREITTSGALVTGIAAGKAVVATRLPAFEELLKQDEAAELVTFGHTEGLAAALLRLIHDPALCKRLGEGASRLAAATPSWDEIAQRTRAFYSALAATGGDVRARSPWMAQEADATHRGRTAN
jgi:glycosyltransferase involved in cell wall biosynthesis